MINIQIIIENFNFLKTIQPGDKFIIDKNTHKIFKDERYFMSFRRSYNTDSRHNLDKTIIKMFNQIYCLFEFNNSPFDINDVLLLLKNLDKIFILTYPDFYDLHKTIESFILLFTDLQKKYDNEIKNNIQINENQNVNTNENIKIDVNIDVEQKKNDKIFLSKFRKIFNKFFKCLNC